MGKLVEYHADAGKPIAPGVTTAPITGADGQHMKADYINLSDKAVFTARVPEGCDQYVFVLGGEGQIGKDGGQGQAVAPGTFALVEENNTFTVRTDGAPCQLLSVIAPPPGKQTSASGFKGGLKVLSARTEPVDDFPEKKKQRIYFVTEEVGTSERAHGMIVKYVPETETTMHAHPDAESLFVFLEGLTDLQVNGKPAVGKFGNAAFFPAGDKHSLHGTPGGSNFIEFHIPGKYTTVR